MMNNGHVLHDAPAGARSNFWLPLVGALLCLVPLFVTPVLPLIDFYAHIARYHVLAQIGETPALGENYQANWRMLPNLGMDILGTGVMKVLPPLLAAKFLTGLVILAPFAGSLYLARSLQGYVTPLNVALSGLLAFNLILGWGFANFLLGMGIALWGIGWWISQTDNPRRQLIVTMALGILLLFIHGLVFGLWGLMLIMVELMLIARSGPIRFSRLAIGMGRLALVAFIPVVLFFQTKTASAEGGITVAFTNLAGYAEKGLFWERVWDEVLQRIDGILRVTESSWPMADRGFGLVLWGALIAGLAIGWLRLDRRLWLAAGLAALLIWIMPPNLFGVGHLDERMPLLLLTLLAAGLSVNSARSRLVSAGFMTLFALHMAMVSIGWMKEGQSYTKYLAALGTLEPGGLGATAFIGDAQQRDPSRSCKPLLFLMLLENGTAVHTFSNPTQQPLALQGDLLASHGRADPLANVTDGTRQTEVSNYLNAGFDTVVTCDMTPTTVEGASLVDEDGKWALYQAKP